MTSAIVRRALCGAVLVMFVSVGGGCKAPSGPAGGEGGGVKRAALTSPNGLLENGLWTNGLWTNGLWTNGLWTNGLWTNGLWTNGAFENGLWTNGLWTNGLWTNGLWTNGLWTNGLWTNGLWADGTWQTGARGDTLRASAYARQLLQYVYACAMPGTLDADSGMPVYGTTLDPNAGALTCSSPASCDLGYDCVGGKCVIPLAGMIGLGINADGTTWWETGKCDVSCQRWVSACVLARTNAYGAHVQISMRAPANAPQAIKDALAVTDVERNGDQATGAVAYSLREGAYYGNIFGTTPEICTGSTCAPAGPSDAWNTVVSTPAFYACAGPGSNIPEITKRFCSSQGDQVVINVPGVCLKTAAEQGTCSKADTNPASPTFGAMQDCYLTRSAAARPACKDYKDPSCFNEVITVFLKEPLAVCGNNVCETPTEDAGSCATDCLPGTWAKTYDPLFSVQIAPAIFNQTLSQFNYISKSAIGYDDTVVVVGDTPYAVGLEGGPLAASADNGILIKYNPDGSYAWPGRAVRFANPVPGSQGGAMAWAVTTATKGAAKGNIGVIGRAPDNLGDDNIWLKVFDANGVPAWQGSWAFTGSPTRLNPTRAFAFDSQGNVILAGEFGGTATFPTSPPKQLTSADWSEVFLAKVTPAGTMLWATPVPGSIFVGALALDSNDNIILSAWQSSQTSAATLFKRCPNGATGTCPDGSTTWSKDFGGRGGYTVVTVDGAGNVYAGGGFGNGFDVGGGPISQTGLPPAIVKYDKNGAFQWLNHANITCPLSNPSCFNEIWSTNLSFDPAGNVVLSTWGNGGVGGGIDFGIGPFPTYSQANAFLSAYTPSGANAGKLVWAKQVPGILGIDLMGMAVDSVGRVVVSGHYGGSMQVGGQFLVTPVPESTSIAPLFLASFNGPSSSDKAAPAIGAASDSGGALPTTVPSRIVAQATGADGAVVFFMPPTATDAGHAGTSVTCLPKPNTLFKIGTTTVTCTAVDPLGNKSTAQFSVTVVESLPPVFAPMKDIAVDATGPNGAVVSFAPTANDESDGPRGVSCVPPSGSLFHVGTTTVTCKAHDDSNNESQMSFDVKVAPQASPVTVTCAGAAGAPVAVSTAPGVCGATVGPGALGSCLAGGVALASCTFDGATSETVGPGDHAITVVGTATDGTTASCVSYVRVSDGEKPVASCPGTTVECAGAGGTSLTPTASCTDNCGCSASCVAGVFPVGTSSGSCTATDAAGNTATCAPAITVVDSGHPVVTPLAGASQVQCHVDTWRDPGATAVDACVGDLTNAIAAAGVVDPDHVGLYTRTYSVADPSGNIGTASRSVSVVDTLAPATTVAVAPKGTVDPAIAINITSYSVTPKGGGTPVTGTATCWTATTSTGFTVKLQAADACGIKDVTYALTGAQTGGATVAGGVATVNVTAAGNTTVAYFGTDQAGNREVTRTVPLNVGRSSDGFGFSCSPSPSLKNLPAHGTVKASGTVTITSRATGKKVTKAFSFTFSY